jgi:hypothetical protein
MVRFRQQAPRPAPTWPTLACAVLGALAAGWDAAAQPAASPAPPSPPFETGVAQGLSTTRPSASQRLAAAMSQLGMTTCSSRLQQVMDFLLEGQDGDFTVQPLGPDANRWPVVVTLESAHPAHGHTRFAVISASPGMGCSGFYEQTIYWPEPCVELKRRTFSSFGGSHVLYRNVQASELNAGLQLYLIPSGAGCVSVKKELFH